MTKKNKEVAALHSVKYTETEDGDDVLVTFRVIDDDYKKMVLQIARRDDIIFSIQGEKLFAETK